MAKTELFVRKQPGGMFTVVNEGMTTGEIFFVHSGTGTDGDGYGKNPDAPFATLDYAIGKCTANKKDIIFVMPGHAETWTTTGAKVVADVAGITIIGQGQGADRPTFSFGHTGTTWTISAASVTLANLLLVSAVDSITTFATISGADCTLLDIETRDTTDIEVIDAFIVTGDRLTVKRHFHNGYAGGNANARVFKLNGVDNASFEGCRFMTKVTTAVINFVTTACTNIVIKNCDFLVTSTTDLSKTVVDTITGSTWEVTDCFDLAAGAGFSGGSGGALAKDDVSTVISNIGTLTNTGGTATLGGILGDVSNVSVATNLAKLGTITNTGGTATVGGVLGDVANSSIATRLTNLGSGLVRKTITYTGETSYASFTVTGCVAVKVVGYVTTALTNHADTTSVGTATSAAGLIAATAGTAMQTVGQAWVDNAPSKFETFPANWSIIGNGEDIAVVGTANITGGVVDLYCFYIPLSADGAVAAA